jgi:hypothetical protein
MRNIARQIRENRTITARYLYSALVPQCCQQIIQKNSVQKLTQGWLLVGKFLNGARVLGTMYCQRWGFVL